MNKKSPYFLVAIALLGMLLMAFDNGALEDENVKTRYDELVADFVAAQDKACQQAALEEAELTWDAATNGGEEEATETHKRLSKPEGSDEN